ncbi:MAG: hypothetical protein AVDCRST_MAG73-767 [uncultured Thermomicrobiales bacterium]|uniref:Uncharacterized protein n=1 Tax=uncultured Thermomicrobiales bacterium TaxID=1645740 RepID=A0A6J4TPZ6_9BACT|nr:MAG: hypothetical protein AVDCRST_MAG73-767 [uncultured Thermomicrobiales bacterium]
MAFVPDAGANQLDHLWGDLHLVVADDVLAGLGKDLVLGLGLGRFGAAGEDFAPGQGFQVGSWSEAIGRRVAGPGTILPVSFRRKAFPPLSKNPRERSAKVR